jgi:hypothetical protein
MGSGVQGERNRIMTDRMPIREVAPPAGIFQREPTTPERVAILSVSSWPP